MRVKWAHSTVCWFQGAVYFLCGVALASSSVASGSGDIVPDWCEFGYRANAEYRVEAHDATLGMFTAHRETKDFNQDITCTRRDRSGAFGELWPRYVENNQQREPTEESVCRYFKETASLAVEGSRVADCLYKDLTQAGRVQVVVLTEIPHQDGGTILDMTSYHIGTQTRLSVRLADFYLKPDERMSIFTEMLERIIVRD